jgi:hypothetical protein
MSQWVRRCQRCATSATWVGYLAEQERVYIRRSATPISRSHRQLKSSSEISSKLFKRLFKSQNQRQALPLHPTNNNQQSQWPAAVNARVAARYDRLPSQISFNNAVSLLSLLYSVATTAPAKQTTCGGLEGGQAE